MRKLGLSLSLTSAAMAVRSAFKIASVNPVLWWDAESHRAGLAGGAATLFQNSVGTSAVTAVEQPVGRAVDQSGNARHAMQATSTARPVLTARVNLLQTSESNLGWIVLGGTGENVVGGGIRVKPTEPHALYGVAFWRDSQFNGAGNYVFSFDARSDGTRWCYANIQGNTPAGVWFDLQAGVVGLVGSGFSGSISPLGNGWYRCSVLHNRVGRIFPLIGICDVNGSVTVAASSSTGITLNRLMLNDGVVQASYQKSFTSMSYDIAAAPLMLQFDGVDDALSSATFAAGTLPANADVYVVVKRAAGDGNSVLLYSGANYVGMVESGSSSRPDSGTGIPIYTVNGSSVTATRTALNTALPAGTAQLLEVRGADLSTWTAATLGQFASYPLSGGVGAVLITPAQPDATRAKIRKALANAYQITGVV